MLCLAYALINFVLPVKHADVIICIFASHSQTKTFISPLYHMLYTTNKNLVEFSNRKLGT